MILSREEKILRKLMRLLIKKRDELWRKEKRYVFKEIDEFLAVADDEIGKIKEIRKIRDEKLQKIEAEQWKKTIRATADMILNFFKRHKRAISK